MKIRSIYLLLLLLCYGGLRAQEQENFTSLENKTHWVNQIQDITELPVGIRENKNGVEYAMMVTKATFSPNETRVNIYARITFPDTQNPSGKRELYFGATEIPFSYEGQLVGDVHLSLLGDVTLSNTKNWSFLLKGGRNVKGETVDDQTYVEVDCNGLKKIALRGIIRISNELIVPVDNKLQPIANGYVESEVAIEAEDFNNLLVELKLPAFALTRQIQNKDKGAFIFHPERMVLDMSDTSNAPAMVFPQGYDEYLVAGQESWRGFYIQELTVTLPEEFKKTEGRVSLKATNFLLDAYGFSGSLSADNIISFEEGRTSEDKKKGWKYAIHHIQADFVASKLKGGALSGAFRIPIEKDDSRGIHFDGSFSEDNYMLRVSSLDSISFDMWKAKAVILPSSYVELQVKNKEFLPKVVLDGSMVLEAPKSDKNLYRLEGINFQKFTLQTQAPYISAEYFGCEGEQKIAGFPVSIKDVSVAFREERAQLHFGIRVGLQKDKFSAEGDFNIYAKNTDEHWSYDKFEINRLKLEDVDIVVAKVSGELNLMKNDPVYGNGFKAKLSTKITSLDVDVNANAVFGSKDFRYWGFEAMVDGLNINTQYVKITGFIGGAYYQMRPLGNPKDKEALEAFSLVPDEKIGLGLKAGVLGAFQDKRVISFIALLDIQTYKGGGLSKIGFYGNATVMYALQDKLSNPFATVQKGFADNVQKVVKMEELAKNEKYKYLDNSGKADIPDDFTIDESNESKKAPIFAQLNVSYDFAQKAYHSNMEVYVNVAGGVIRGTGNSGLAGRAVLHIDPQDWYYHLGTTREMMGLQVGFGDFLNIKAQTYFMVGTKIGEAPQPPAKVAEILKLNPDEIGYMKSLNQIKEGKGFAFGAHLNFDTKFDVGFLYASFAAGFGSDLMLKNYGNAHCKGRSGELGINGWYANGQTYVYLQGELGIKIKLFFIRKRIPILSAGVAALLQGSGPNPFWARGYLGGYYNVLGGLVKGRFRLKMEFGEQCELASDQVLGGMKIISDVSPSDRSEGVDVFLSPQATFNLELEKPIVIPEDDRDHTYIVNLEKFEVLDAQGNTIEGKLTYGKSQDELNFTPREVLPSHQKLKAVVSVSFKELKGGSYQTVMVDGKKAVETEERTFTTGEAPEYIPNKNIKYAYPVLDQKNYFIGESNEGFVQLKQGQSYLFEDAHWNTRLFIEPEGGGKTLELNPTYLKAENKVSFTMPKLSKATKYGLSIVSYSKQGAKVSATGKTQQKKNNIKVSEGDFDKGEDETSYTFENKKAQANVDRGGFERLSYQFNTSKYERLSDKMKKFKIEHLWIKYNSAVALLQNDMNTDEPFEEAELIGTTYSGIPLIKAEAVLDDKFDALFTKYLYNNSQGQTWFSRDNDVVGYPPKEAVTVFPFYPEELKWSSYDVKRVFPYRYDVFMYYQRDWDAQHYYFANHLNELAKNPLYNEFMELYFPVLPTKNYKAVLKYRLPDGKITSETPYKYKF